MTREPTTTMSVSRQERSAACSVAWLCAFVLGACTPDEQEEPFSPKYVAGSVKMTTSYDNPLCTGNILLAERHSTWLTEVFGTVGDMDFWVGQEACGLVTDLCRHRKRLIEVGSRRRPGRRGGGIRQR
ncbi:MAG: hypothetical protein H6710_17450 [Myxococcales bacterium]|nr:hypothetical protein [Myxococcales bacterium]